MLSFLAFDGLYKKLPRRRTPLHGKESGEQESVRSISKKGQEVLEVFHTIKLGKTTILDQLFGSSTISIYIEYMLFLLPYINSFRYNSSDTEKTKYHMLKWRTIRKLDIFLVQRKFNICKNG